MIGNPLYTPTEVMQALYRAVLGRDPDPEGLKNYSEILTTDPGALLSVCEKMFESDEHRKCFDHAPAILDHSQYREFSILLRHHVAQSQRHGIIVDVGARGKDRSNSYDLLSQFGWRGVLVEANPALHESIRRDFADTNFELVPTAVGPNSGVLPFYIGANDDVSSLLRDNAAGWGDLRGVVEVEVQRLDNILTKRMIPFDFDVLSLDIEGLDVDVLNDLVDNSDYRPLIVIIEASYDFETK